MTRWPCGLSGCALVLVRPALIWVIVLALPAAWCQTPAAPAASSAVSAGEPLTLAQAYRLAMDQDATIRKARAAADARRERLPQARAQLLPNVSANVSKYKNNLTTTLGGVRVNSNQRYISSSQALVIRQPIFRPYQTADLRQAQAQVEDANATLDKETQSVAVRVASAYFDALLAQDQLELVLAQERSYTTELDSARKRLSAGAGLRTDIDEAQARLDLAVADELAARQNVAYTRRQLQVLVNRPVTALAPVDESRLQLAPPSPERLDEWTDRAEQSSPEMRSLKAQREAARQQIDKVRAGHLPTLDAVAQWSIGDSDEVTRVNSRFDNKAVGLQLNVPLFAGGYVNSQARQAVAELEQAEQALEATRRDLGLRVENEFRAINEGVLRVPALEQAVRSADVMVQSSIRSLAGGSRTMVDILNAQEQRTRALRDLASARYVYILAQVRLRALTGEADDQAIAEIDRWFKP